MKSYRAEVTFNIDFVVIADNPLDNLANENTVLRDILEDAHAFAHPHAIAIEWSSIKGPYLHFPYSQAPQTNQPGGDSIPTLVRGSRPINADQRCARKSLEGEWTNDDAEAYT